jgi:hypothetical protein
LETKSKAPYNPLGSPYKTVGQFNRGVLKLAENEYKPGLENIEGEEAGEKATTGERTADLGNIYNTYSQEAQQAFQDAKSSLAEIAAKNQTADQGAQQTLQAALGGAPNAGGALGTALAEGQIGSGALAGLQSSLVGSSAKLENVPAVARTEALNQEFSRDNTAKENLAAEKGKVVASIPNAIEKARQALLTNEQNRQGLQFQQNLAGKQFGLSKEAQRSNEKKANAEIGMNRTKMNQEFSLHEQELSAQAGLNIEKLAIAKEKIQNERGKAAGARAKNSISIMTNFLKPNKNEYMPGQQTHELNQIPYRRDPNALFKLLIVQGGLGNNEAIQLMVSSGHPEVEKYAREYQQQEKQHAFDKKHPVPQIKLPKL